MFVSYVALSLIDLKSLDMRITASHTLCTTADVTGKKKKSGFAVGCVCVLRGGLRTTDREICSIAYMGTAKFQNTPWSTRYRRNLGRYLLIHNLNMWIYIMNNIIYIVLKIYFISRKCLNTRIVKAWFLRKRSCIYFRFIS
jgi:hypothetical protein